MTEVSGGAEIEAFILHDLRRTAASGMAQLGIPPHVVDRILNHSSGTIRGIGGSLQSLSIPGERRRRWPLGGLMSPD